MLSAQDALTELKAGNQRYVTGNQQQETNLNPKGRSDLLQGQAPFAVIIGCADSRVPVEMIFDQGLGDLFVIRVAGNVITPTQTGSVEYAVANLGTRLVVVLGHTGCGAVSATVAELRKPTGSLSPGLTAIVERIAPAVESVLKTEQGRDDAQLLCAAVRANVGLAVSDLRSGSSIIEQLCEQDGLTVVGAEYSLESGEVAFL